MCGSKSATIDFITNNKPERDILSLIEELKNIGERYKTSDQTNHIKWNKAIICKNDNIFPYSNQITFWKNYNNIEIIEIESSHYSSEVFSIKNLINLLK